MSKERFEHDIINGEVNVMKKFKLTVTEVWEYEVTAENEDEAYDKVHNREEWDKQTCQENVTEEIENITALCMGEEASDVLKEGDRVQYKRTDGTFVKGFIKKVFMESGSASVSTDSGQFFTYMLEELEREEKENV